MAKVMVVVPEQKEVIKRLGKRYEYLEKNEKTSAQTHSLDIGNRLLNTATKDVGFSPTLTIRVPDPSEGLQELAMKSLPSLLKCSTRVVENRNREVADSMDVHARMDTIEALSDELRNASEQIEVTMSK